MSDRLARYDIERDYSWNYEHAPEPVEIDVPPFPGDWTFLGKPVNSPLGIPAGPLLNGRWIRYYAKLGFDILTYKTVRSSNRDCYPLPNLVPVETGMLSGDEEMLRAGKAMSGSWAVSFGMPSAPPDRWRRDVEETRRRLGTGQLLVVSVVGTIRPGWSIDELAEDYARCARWAVESGADAVEANLSCPNVSTPDGQLYRDPTAAGIVACRIRQVIGASPLILKIGHITERDLADSLLEEVGPSADALAMTNSVATRVQDIDGSDLFDRQRRGICGDATRRASLEQTRLFQRLLEEKTWNIELIGVGGISTFDHVRAYLEAGAETVQIATAAMVDPAVGIRIREQASMDEQHA